MSPLEQKIVDQAQANASKPIGSGFMTIPLPSITGGPATALGGTAAGGTIGPVNINMPSNKLLIFLTIGLVGVYYVWKKL